MAEPHGDGCQAGAGAQQFHGSGVPQGVRTDLLVEQLRAVRCCQRNMFADYARHAITAEALFPGAHEQRLVGGAGPFRQPMRQHLYAVLFAALIQFLS